MTVEEQMEKIYATGPFPWGVENREYITLGLLNQYYQGGKIVEFGCGNGKLFTMLSTPLQPFYEGVDISHSIIKFCKTRFNKRQFFQGDIEKDIHKHTPFPGAGAIICSDVIPYLSEGVSEEVQLDLFNSLVEGGILIASSWYSKQGGSKHVSPFFWADKQGATVLFTGESITRDKDGLFYNANWYIVGRKYALPY